MLRSLPDGESVLKPTAAPGQHPPGRRWARRLKPHLTRHHGNQPAAAGARHTHQPRRLPAQLREGTSASRGSPAHSRRQPWGRPSPGGGVRRRGRGLSECRASHVRALRAVHLCGPLASGYRDQRGQARPSRPHEKPQGMLQVSSIPSAHPSRPQSQPSAPHRHHWPFNPWKRGERQASASSGFYRPRLLRPVGVQRREHSPRERCSLRDPVHLSRCAAHWLFPIHQKGSISAPCSSSIFYDE